MGPSPQSVPPHFLAILLLQSGTSRAAEKQLLNIQTHASMLFFAIYLRARTLPFPLLRLGSKLLRLFFLAAAPVRRRLQTAEQAGHTESRLLRKKKKAESTTETEADARSTQLFFFLLAPQSRTRVPIFPNHLKITSTSVSFFFSLSSVCYLNAFPFK